MVFTDNSSHPIELPEIGDRAQKLINVLEDAMKASGENHMSVVVSAFAGVLGVLAANSQDAETFMTVVTRMIRAYINNPEAVTPNKFLN